MSFSDDEEILQDFLLEVGEILELLSEQLVDLEQRPDDVELLNAIFRGFHTVKGGAGFLQFDTMVEICHVTENLFDVLRTGKRKVTTNLMDVVLKVLDSVNLQFDQISNSQTPEPADPLLFTALSKLVDGTDAPEPVESVIQTSNKSPEGETQSVGEAAKDKVSTSDDEPDDIAEDEFEALLDALHGKGKAPTIAKESSVENVQEAPVSDQESAGNEQDGSKKSSSQKAKTEPVSLDISDSEFEDLLDELHGSGKAPGKINEPSKTYSQSDSDTITEDEFEDLLDQLHGVGEKPVENKAAIESPGNAESSIIEPPKTSPKKPERQTSAPRNIDLPAKDASELKSPPKVTEEIQKPKLSSSPASASVKDKSKDVATKSSARGGTDVTVRVDTQRLDDIMNMVGELVLVRNRLVRLGSNRNDEELTKAVSLLDVVTGDLQSEVMKTRMQPIRKVFGRFPRVVRDLARSLNKEISLQLKGEDTDLDKNLVEALADPLIHLVRNAADHGIEMPEVRERAGKSRIGKVVLDARQEGDHILLSITDDGAGMDPDFLRRKAVEKHIMDADAAARLTDKEAFDLIFAPGFSTKTDISDVSGRGVGMDVVKTKITQLNGLLDIDSTVGEGTSLTIKVPLTLAIMPTLMILLEDQTFALPLVSVNEIFHMDLTRTHVVDGQECVTIRDRAVPIFHLKRWLVSKPSDVSVLSFSHVVIVSVGSMRVGFVVDDLIGQEEVVIKPLGKMLQGTPGMAGATITGNGSIALILDVPGMLKQYAGTA